MKKRMFLKIAMVMFLFFVNFTAERADSQSQQSSPMSPSQLSSSGNQSNNLNNLEVKLEMLQYKLDTETKALEKRYDDFVSLTTFFMTFLSIFVAVLTIFSIFKNLQQHKDYITERTFFNESANKFEGKQLENIEKLNSVIGLVEKTFNLQHKQYLDQQKLVDDFNGMQNIITQLQNAEIEKYHDAKKMILSLAGIKAMEWPKLADEIQSIADKARSKLEQVSKIVLVNEEEKKPYELAKVYQLTGISAFYSNDIVSTFKYLGEADRIYEERTLRPEDNMSRAYTKHFLGVAAKNWRKIGDTERGNLDEAYEYLLKANTIVSEDRNQFLIPVTLSEILSYQSERTLEATQKIDELIQRFEEFNQLDYNQTSLFLRTYFLKGNLEVKERRFEEARRYYEEAQKLDKGNAYAHLSILHAQENLHPQNNKDIQGWKEALSLLERSGATKKRETVTKVIALTWSVIATHNIKDESGMQKYLKEFESIGGAFSSIIDRTPLFFSPISKDIMEFTDLKSSLYQYIGRDKVS